MNRRVIGKFTDYAGMLAVVRSRVAELQIQGLAFDHFAGLPLGYLSKLTGQNPVRRIGMMSMGPLFDALGICCVVIEDPARTQRLKNRLRPRNGSFVRSMPRIVRTDRQLRLIGKLGRLARWEKLTATQRSTIMRALAQRRWR